MPIARRWLPRRPCPHAALRIGAYEPHFVRRDGLSGPPWAGGCHCACVWWPSLSRACASLRSLRYGLPAALDNDSLLVLEVVVVFGFDVGEGGAEVAEGPFLGEGSSVAEHDGDVGVADLDACEKLGHEAGGHPIDLEQGRVAVLDYDRGAFDGGELGERVGEVAVDEPADEIIEALAFDDSDDLVVKGDAVVTGWQRLPLCRCLLAGEPVGVALAGVDEDGQLLESRGAAGGDAHAGARPRSGLG